MAEYTKTERAILNMLSDGQPHLPDDLLALLPDDQSGPECLHNHLCRMRKKLPGKQAIICQFLYRKRWFRLMSTIS